MIATLAAIAFAGTPVHLTHQGRLLDAAGGPIEGPTTLVVSLYDAEGATTPFHTETFPGHPVQQGYYRVVLGDDPANPLLDTDLPAAGAWVGVSVGATELLPRTRITDTPYAARTARADAAAEVDCVPGFVRLGGGTHGICIQVDPNPEVGCWGDECHRQGYRNCTCVEVMEAIVKGRINPTTDAINTAGEYCLETVGHCHKPTPGASCQTGTHGVISKIYPNPDPASLPSEFYMLDGVSGVPVCDTERPAPHSGYPYGAGRCCY